MAHVPIFQPSVMHYVEHLEDCDDMENNVVRKNVETNSDPIQIKIDDSQDEINFWSASIFYYALGANPPIQVMEGFCKRIWKSYKVDKVALIKSEVFLVRYQAMDSRDKVLNDHKFFDKKSLIIKAWSSKSDFEKEDIKTLLVRCNQRWL